MDDAYRDLMEEYKRTWEEPRKKIADYICERLGMDSQFDNSAHLKRVADFIAGRISAYQNELYQINIDGTPDYELAETEKDNLPLMLRICRIHLDNLAKNGIVPAPFYFERVAILARKEENYQLEVDICEMYLQVMEWYIEAHEKNGIELLRNVRGSRYEKIAKRLPKARALLEKQRAGAAPRTK